MGKTPRTSLGSQFKLEIRDTGEDGFRRWEVITTPHHPDIEAKVTAKLPTLLTLVAPEPKGFIAPKKPEDAASLVMTADPRVSEKLTNATINSGDMSFLYSLMRQGHKDLTEANRLLHQALYSGAVEMEAMEVATRVIKTPSLLSIMDVQLMSGRMCACATHIEFDDDGAEGDVVDPQDLPRELIETAPPEIRNLLKNGNAMVIDLGRALARMMGRPTDPNTLTFRFLDEDGALKASPFAKAVETTVKDLAIQTIRTVIPRILANNEKYVIADAAKIERTYAELMAQNSDDMQNMLAYRKNLAAAGLVPNEPSPDFAAFVKTRTPAVPDLHQTQDAQPRTTNHGNAGAELS